VVSQLSFPRTQIIVYTPDIKVMVERHEDI